MLITNRPNQSSLYERLSQKFAIANEIVVASAYVSPGACEALRLFAHSSKIPVRLSVGRAMREGLARPTRQYLLGLDAESRKVGGGVRIDPIGFHSKLYAASTKENAFGVIGSSNLTENGMSDWVEANVMLAGDDAQLVRDEAQKLYDSGIHISDCIDEIPLVESMRTRTVAKDSIEVLPVERGFETEGLSISLLDNNNTVPEKSGLNWGFAGGRPRDRYECYIRLPWPLIEQAEYVFGSNKAGTTFYANTHDGQSLVLRLQGTQHGDYAKQISTLGRNKTLGQWMVKKCLGITQARPVTAADLSSYGRTDVTFYRTGIAHDGLAIVYIDFLPR